MKSKTPSLHPFLVLLAVAMVSALFVLACGGGGEATQAPAAGTIEAAEEQAIPTEAEQTAPAEAASVSEAAEEQVGVPKRGGKLTMTIVAEYLTLDPPLQLTQVDIAITQQLYDNLLMIQPDGTVKPELATSWEANDDLSSYTFHLREGVKFHHGKDFKAEDVLSTFERVMDPVIDSPIRPTFTSTIKDIIALDDYTVRFDLVGPNAFFLDTLSVYQVRIVPSDVDVERLHLEEFGTGPFMIVEHLPGERTVMVRNPDYWDEGKPYLDEVTIQLIHEGGNPGRGTEERRRGHHI